MQTLYETSLNVVFNSPINFALMNSPLGDLLITATDRAVHHILFEDMPQTLRILSNRHELIENPAHPLIQQTQTQLAEYFAGQRRAFDLPLDGQGTGYQQKVWAQLCAIPYAITWNYAQLAHELGQPTAARAVGMANGKNPISIVVPCHRVIGKNQQLTGYAGGLERKAWLLAHERQYQ
jgi:methylated-DNA-[protein]-cysteine S-methyltransferase